MADIMLPFVQWGHLNKIIVYGFWKVCGNVMMMLVISFWIVKNHEKVA